VEESAGTQGRGHEPYEIQEAQRRDPAVDPKPRLRIQRPGAGRTSQRDRRRQECGSVVRKAPEPAADKEQGILPESFAQRRGRQTTRLGAVVRSFLAAPAKRGIASRDQAVGGGGGRRARRRQRRSGG